MELNSKQAAKFFWFFALLHTISWTLVPALTRSCYRDDTLEQFTIAREWALASPKHPNLSAWVLETVNLLTNYVYGTPYFVAQMFVLLAVWSVWRIGRQFLSEASAVLGALSFCLFVYCNGRTIEYNNTIPALSLWAFALYWLYFALRDNRPLYWIGLGLTLGAGMNTYYMVLILCAAILFFMLLNRDARRRLAGIGPYLAVAVTLLCFMPQIFRIFFSEADMNRTMAYGMRGTFFGNMHVEEPTWFALSQFALNLPIILVVCPLIGPYWRLRKIGPDDRFNRAFLLFFTLCPFLLFLVFVTATGRPLATRYGSQFWPLVGLSILFLFERIETLRRYLWSVGLGLFVDGAILCYVVVIEVILAPFWTGPGFLVHFPAHELGRQTQAVWNEYYAEPCPFIGGEYRLASAAGIGMADHPRVHAFDKVNCNSTEITFFELHSDAAINESGGVILWMIQGRHPKDGEVDYPNGVPAKLFERYPNAKVRQPLSLKYRLWSGAFPIEIGVAVVPIPNREPLKPFSESSEIKH